MSKIRLIITSIISIVLVSVLLFGSTYSIFTTTEIDNELNVYKTGDLNIKYSSNNIKIIDTTPMTIEEADSVIPHRITVTNNGNVAYQFDVILRDTTSSDSTTIDYQYIMTKVGYLEPKSLSNCTNNIIKEDIILLPGDSIDIDVRVWLADNISNSEMGKSFYAKLQIDGQAIINNNKEINNDILSLNYISGNYFNNDTYKNYIKMVSFVDYIDTSNASIDATTNEKIMQDVSDSKNKPNSVVTWLEDNGTMDDNGNKYYNLYIGSNERIYAQSLRGFLVV